MKYNMATITIPKKELKAVVKESIREVLIQESMKLRALLSLSVSQKEQKDIERLYRTPLHSSAKSIEIEI
jgi:hypothetical protein